MLANFNAASQIEVTPMRSAVKRLIQTAASATTPWAQTLGKDGLWVLMYHRILPTSDQRFALEEPGMVVTPETFRQQLQWAKQLFTILPLSEWIARRNANKPLPKRACAITFDDGWLDNYEFALPILQQEQVPATLFAVSHAVGTNFQFWPNRVARLIDECANWSINPELKWISQTTQIDSNQPINGEQLARIIASLKQLPDSELNQQLDETESALHLPQLSAPSLASWEQLREMQDTGLIDIGSHTCHHFRLTEQLPTDILEQEIVESRHLLEQQLERPVSLFCYPNGDTSPLALRLVNQHYAAAVTTQRGINAASTPLHELLRIGVHEQITDTRTKFKARLSGWM